MNLSMVSARPVAWRLWSFEGQDTAELRCAAEVSIVESVSAGPTGYLQKHSDKDMLLSTVREVDDEEFTVQEEAARRRRPLYRVTSHRKVRNSVLHGPPRFTDHATTFGLRLQPQPK